MNSPLIRNPVCRHDRGGLPLALIPNGDTVTVLCCNTRDPDLERHLFAMGLGRDVIVEVVSNENGRITVSTGDSRIGIDAELARRIRVAPVESAIGQGHGRHRRRRRGGHE